jgi:hypothetical protein
MNRFGRTRVAPAALLLAAALWATPPPARADFQIQLYEDGNLLASPGTLSDNGSGVITYTGMAGDFSIAFTFNSTTPGADDKGTLSVDNARITNRTSAEHTLTMMVSSQGFTSPAGSALSLVNSISGTVSRGTVEGNLTTYADRGNTLFGTSDLATDTFKYAATTVVGFVDPDLAANLPPPSNTFAGSQDTAGTTTTSGFSTGGTYSITSVGNFDLYGFSSVTFSELSQVHAPAPSGVVLALSGVPVLGLGSWFRARRRQNVTV